MTQARKALVSPSQQEAAETLLAIASFRDGKTLKDLRGGAAAILLWSTLYIRNGFQAGVIKLQEADMVAMIGAESVRALDGSKGSSGPLQRLIQAGAIKRLGDATWQISLPDDLRTPHVKPVPNDPLLPAMRDKHDEPEDVDDGGVLRGGFPAESPASAEGGGGGVCASDSENEIQNSSSPSTSASAIGGFRGESPGLTPDGVLAELEEFGLTFAQKLVPQARERGCSLQEILAAKVYAELHAADWKAPAAALLGDKLKLMRPGQSVHVSFPPVPTKPAADRSREKLEAEVRRHQEGLATKRIKELRLIHGKDEAAIRAGVVST